jgi:thiamine pyrophosphate-dependent acetolactate synthase large subunit-like protein
MSGPQLSDQPFRAENEASPVVGWGSDAIVEQLSRLNLRYIALVPGSSYRGVHDSLINFKGNSNPEMLVCLHEEHAIAIAHGYAKVTERPMAAAVHANVGLMHATMAIYNAFCDRVPMLILGATGPLDAAKRRPWIDWIHTATDQAALIRPFIKFDDQPSSVNAAISGLIRATSVTITKPSAPVYVCLDVNLQEDKVDPKTVQYPDMSRYLPPSPPSGSAEDAITVLKLLNSAKKPLFLFGRVNRTTKSWNQRVELAEKFNARVLTDLKQGSAFPTAHRLHATAPSVFNTPKAAEFVREADVIVSFDWVDLSGSLQAAHAPGVSPASKIVSVSLDTALHNGWSKDHFGQAPVDVLVAADGDEFLNILLEGSKTTDPKPSVNWDSDSTPQPRAETSPSEDIFMGDLSAALYAVIKPEDMCLVRLPLGWKGEDLQSTHPLAYLGLDGAAGLASGPGQAVGAALALKDSPMSTVAILGDGDFLMGSSALWTATRYRLPLLVIVANNASFFNDEVHQERVARARTRPLENKWIGMRLDDPLPDLSKNAASFGCEVNPTGQVKLKSQLEDVLKKAIFDVKSGKTVVIDVQVLPEGYASGLEGTKK